MASITDRQINAKPGTGSRWLSESVIRGHGALTVRITPKGERIFYFRYIDSQGKRVTMPIGNYSREEKLGCLTLTQARLRAKELAGLHQSGITNLREHLEAEEQHRQAREEAERIRLERENQLHRSRMTINDLFKHWMKVDLIRRKDRGESTLRLFTIDVLPKIGQLAAEDIRRSHVTQITDSIMARGAPRMAKVALSEMRQMFRFAVVREIIEADPTAAIAKANIGGKNMERDRVLSEEEVRLLVKQMPDAGLMPTTELAVWIALSTGCRIGELLSAEWGHINIEQHTWYMPSTKNGKPHTVYLSDFAVQQFRALQQHTGSGQWCYPNRNGTAPVCPKTVNKQLQDRQRQPDQDRMSGRSKSSQALLLPGGKWTPHDLRRTAATMMVEAGILPEVAERCLNHAEQNRVKRTYQRHSYAAEMQHAWQTLGQRLAVLTQPEGSNVISASFGKQAG
ncbi:integrase [Marinobacterium iners]|uniref:tyrosine-type recombinase/integrase n=1 Tax=Marinobacterium iners TaxID=48076 RepID=UPI001A8CEABA|nr:site-specific integrase [Marinobacterium iners]QSR34159.1 integrase [Marinobacterium iners]